MTYAIVYDSRTGNTKRLAQAVAETLPADGAARIRERGRGGRRYACGC